MASATSIVERLIDLGVIPSEFKDDAILELHRELTRRTRRTALVLASLASAHQLALRYALQSA